MRKSAIALAGLLAVSAAACSTSQTTGQAAVPSAAQQALTRAITVSEGDMYLHPSATVVASGKVTFTVTNGGQAHHEFVIVTGDPTGTTGEPGKVTEDNHIGGAEGPEIGDISPGQTETLTARLTPGTYTAMCNLPGHFGAGMHFQFVVQ